MFIFNKGAIDKNMYPRQEIKKTKQEKKLNASYATLYLKNLYKAVYILSRYCKEV